MHKNPQFWLLVKSQESADDYKSRSSLLDQNWQGKKSSAGTYLQLPLPQWGAGNVYLLVLSSRNENIAENPIAVMGLL